MTSAAGESIEYATPLGPVEIGPYRQGDERGILDLFRRVFRRERPEAEWHWLFRDCPEGIHCYLGRNEHGEVVSQFAGIPVRVKVRGQTFIFGQIVDSMVDPRYRTALKRKGLFSTTVDAFVERYGRADEEIIMMGLPNPPAFRIGRKLCGYVPMGKVYMHTLPIEPEPGTPEIPPEVTWRGHRFSLQRVARFSPDVDELYARLASRHTVIGVRDARHLNWRYAGCPQPRYHALEIRTADGLLAGIAVGVVGYLDQADGVIADWLVDDGIAGAREALLTTIEQLMRTVSMTQVKCLLNPMAGESRFFEDRGYTLTPTHYRMVSRTYAGEIVHPEWLNRHWYYTLGDFDVV